MPRATHFHAATAVGIDMGKEATGAGPPPIERFAFFRRSRFLFSFYEATNAAEFCAAALAYNFILN